MSRNNVNQSLDSVELALRHFATSLEKAGFQKGAAAYQKMAAVVVGQRLWANSEGIDEFDDRFRRVAALAEDIRSNLAPYVEVMEKLRVIAELVDTPVLIASEPVSARILAVLKDANRPMSQTAIRSAVGDNVSMIRRELSKLVKRGVVEKTGSSSRPAYALAG